MRFALVLAFALAVVFAPPRYAEEYHTTILQNVSFVRSIASGAWPTWIPELVLGVPAPLAHSQIFHPAIWLYALFDFQMAVAVFVVAHAGVAALALVVIARRLQLPAWLVPFGLVPILFAPAMIRSVFETNWVTLVAVYTLAVALIACFLRLIDPRVRPLPTAIAFGYLAGLMTSAGHPGYLVCFLPAIAILFAGNWRALGGRWGYVLASAAIAIAMSVGQIYPILYNSALFGDVGTRYYNSVDNVHVGQLFAFLIGTADFSAVAPAQHTWLWRQAFSPWWYTAYGGMFFILGAPVLVSRNPLYRSFAVATAVSILLMFVPERLAGGLVSASWLFGDAATVTGTISGMIGASWLAAAGYTTLLRGGLVLQSVCLSVAPVQLAGANLLANLGVTTERPGYTFDLARIPEFITPMIQSEAGHFNRVYFGQQFERTVNANQNLLRAGMVNNTPPFHGVGSLTAYAKGVWLGDVNPPVGPMRNWFYPGPDDLTDKLFLDVLSVDFALALDGDRLAENLHVQDVYTYAWTNERVRLLRNPTAWPDGVFVRPDARHAVIPNGARCPHQSIYCMDFEKVASFRVDSPPAEVSRIGGSYDLRLEPAVEPRLLLIADLFRPGWIATSEAGAVEVVPLFRGLMGVTVPGHASHIRLRFVPMPESALMGLSLLTTWAATVVLVGFAIRAATSSRRLRHA